MKLVAVLLFSFFTNWLEKPPFSFGGRSWGLIPIHGGGGACCCCPHHRCMASVFLLGNEANVTELFDLFQTID